MSAHAKRPPLLLTRGAPGATRPRMGGACLLETPHAKRTMRPTFDTALDGAGGVNRLSSNRFAWGVSNKVAGESMKLQHGGIFSKTGGIQGHRTPASTPPAMCRVPCQLDVGRPHQIALIFQR